MALALANIFVLFLILRRRRRRRVLVDPFDVIYCADCLYDGSFFSLLLESLGRFLEASGGYACIVISYEERGQEELFFRRAREELGLDDQREAYAGNAVDCGGGGDCDDDEAQVKVVVMRRSLR